MEDTIIPANDEAKSRYGIQAEYDLSKIDDDSVVKVLSLSWREIKRKADEEGNNSLIKLTLLADFN